MHCVLYEAIFHLIQRSLQKSGLAVFGMATQIPLQVTDIWADLCKLHTSLLLLHCSSFNSPLPIVRHNTFLRVLGQVFLDPHIGVLLLY